VKLHAATLDPTQTTTLLWVDDQIQAFGSHIDDLEESGFSVTTAATTDEALSIVRDGDRFDVILVDLKMPNSDGIELLAQLDLEIDDAQETKIIVLSSFLYQGVIRSRLVKLNMNVGLLEKTRKRASHPASSLAQRINDIVSRDDSALRTSDQFSDWDRLARASDPFDISLESYLDSPMVVRLQLDKEARTATEEVRGELAGEGVVWSLFCGSSHTPVWTAFDVSEIPSDEQVFDLASGQGHPPYEFFEQGEFEEHTGVTSEPQATSRPSKGCPGAPDYPFFNVRVVHHLGDVPINRSRDFHFDSGLDVSAFGLETALKIGLEVENDRPAKFVQYDGEEHAFYTLSGDAYVERDVLGTLQVAIGGRAYLDWDATPFSRRCENFGCTAGKLCYRRHALLGRNLLVENGMQLDLRRINAS
jgi:CheY-like chemotaxis protein